MQWSKESRTWQRKARPECQPGDHDHIGMAANVMPIDARKPWRSKIDGSPALRVALEADGELARTLRDAPDGSLWVVEGVEILKRMQGRNVRILRATRAMPTTEGSMQAQLTAEWIDQARAGE